MRTPKKLERTRRIIIIYFAVAMAMSVVLVLLPRRSYRAPEENLPPAPLKASYFLNGELAAISSREGVVLNDIPQEMTVGNREIVDVRVAKSLSTDLTQRLQGNGDPEINRIKVLPTMGVSLTGTEDYFYIDLKNKNEEKSIDATHFAEWLFEVNPKKAGTPSLYLTVYLVLETPEGNRKYELSPTTKPVIVHSNPAGTTIAFFADNWDKLIGILIGLGVISGIVSAVKKWYTPKR